MSPVSEVLRTEGSHENSVLTAARMNTTRSGVTKKAISRIWQNKRNNALSRAKKLLKKGEPLGQVCKKTKLTPRILRKNKLIPSARSRKDGPRVQGLTVGCLSDSQAVDFLKVDFFSSLVDGIVNSYASSGLV